jgi:hypothetical protein
MSAFNAGHSGDESLENLGITPDATEMEKGDPNQLTADELQAQRDRQQAVFLMEGFILDRPDYAQLRRAYQHVEVDIVGTRVPREHKLAWVDARIDFRNALFELLPVSGSGSVILARGDTRTEHARVTNAAIALHDWFKLYQEVLKQSPPEMLLVIADMLDARRQMLDYQYPPASAAKHTLG